uniref:acid phosphatase n=1 Tax=Marmota marmota marmota TaxID=9994 RepID=A0A8C5ZVY0_MARMA
LAEGCLFLCLSDICQSLLAEAVSRNLATDQHVSDNWAIDCTTALDWNIGLAWGLRAVSNLRNHGINTAIREDRFTKDLTTFDYGLCMEEGNLRF